VTASLIAALALFASAVPMLRPSASARRPAEPALLLGQAAPDWQLTQWVNSPPLTLAGLRGQPVLVRFWTTGCPFCRAAAPVLNELQRDLGPRGLRVIGIYHPKPPREVSRETVEEAARRLGFTFPVAADPDWRTLHAWWLDVPDATDDLPQRDPPPTGNAKAIDQRGGQTAPSRGYRRDTPRGWTSVSFLLDRRGVVRWIHPGGAYSRYEAAELRRRCEELLGAP
jgi:thiol-disulfide isomerase/thioredoxin